MDASWTKVSNDGEMMTFSMGKFLVNSNTKVNTLAKEMARVDTSSALVLMVSILTPTN